MKDEVAVAPPQEVAPDVAAVAVAEVRKIQSKLQKAQAAVKSGTATVRQKKQVAKSKRAKLKRSRKAYAKLPKVKQPGPAFAKWKSRLRSQWMPHQCWVKGCKTKLSNARTKMCAEHKKAYRKDQLKANNQTWYKRIEQGKAKHHVIYKGQLTEWAAQNPVAAQRIVSQGGSVADVELFKKALAKHQAARKL
jgi:hypothetical protein